MSSPLESVLVVSKASEQLPQKSSELVTDPNDKSYFSDTYAKAGSETLLARNAVYAHLGPEVGSVSDSFDLDSVVDDVEGADEDSIAQNAVAPIEVEKAASEAVPNFDARPNEFQVDPEIAGAQTAELPRNPIVEAGEFGLDLRHRTAELPRNPNVEAGEFGLDLRHRKDASSNSIVNEHPSTSTGDPEVVMDLPNTPSSRQGQIAVAESDVRATSLQSAKTIMDSHVATISSVSEVKGAVDQPTITKGTDAKVSSITATHETKSIATRESKVAEDLAKNIGSIDAKRDRKELRELAEVTTKPNNLAQMANNPQSGATKSAVLPSWIAATEPNSFGESSLANRFEVLEEMTGLQQQARFEPVANYQRYEAPIQTARQVTQQVAYAITQTGSGATEIKLQPEELGRVRITVQAVEGVLHVSVLAERLETGDLMRRNTEMLTEQLRDVGFEQINLSFGQETNEQNTSNESSADDLSIFDQENEPQAETVATSKILATGGLDLRL